MVLILYLRPLVVSQLNNNRSINFHVTIMSIDTPSQEYLTRHDCKKTKEELCSYIYSLVLERSKTSAINIKEFTVDTNSFR